MDGLQEFSVVITVSNQLNGTKIRCAARESEGYRHTAVVAVTTKNKCK